MMMSSKVGGGGEQMPLRCGPFRWPWCGVEATNAASPDAACPGLHRKPLDATIRRLLTPYHLSGRKSNSKQKEDAEYVNFADHFDGHRGALVLYHAHRPMEKVRGFHKSH